MCLHHVLDAEKRCIDINKDDPSFYPCTLLALQFHQFFFDRLMSEDSAKKFRQNGLRQIVTYELVL
jgi:hypothetical protein